LSSTATTGLPAATPAPRMLLIGKPTNSHPHVSVAS
jgi:hypothetical protein